MKPISNTAFYCGGVRMQDAENEKPVCGDIYAREFMGEKEKLAARRDSKLRFYQGKEAGETGL